MEAIDAADIATHSEPVWRGRANFLLRVDLEQHGMPGRFEQLWVRRLRPSEFEVCCLPFFTYGFSLGDVLSAEGASDQELEIAGVARKSGRRLLRLAFAAAADRQMPELHEVLHREMIKGELLHEWFRASPHKAVGSGGSS